MTFSFYYLVAKEEIFYVGATRNELSLRLGTHKSEAKNGSSNNQAKAEKILEFWDEIYAHEIEELECTKEEAYDIERYWIDQFRQWGFKLTNSQGLLKYREKAIPKLRSTVTISRGVREILEKIRINKGIFMGRFIDDAIKVHIKKRFPEYLNKESAA